MAIRPFVSYNLAGVWSVSTEDGKTFNMRLPGTLDENNIGHPDTRVPFEHPASAEEQTDLLQEVVLLSEDGQEDQTLLTRFERNLTYTGQVRAYKMITFEEKPGKRLFFEVERTRECILLIDGEEVSPFTPPTLVSPQVFEVTGLLDGNHMVTVVMDNACPSLPGAVFSSNMCSDETQTNWNGLLGFVRVRAEEETFVERVHTQSSDDELTVFVELNALKEGEHFLRLSSDVFEGIYEREITVRAGVNGLKIGGIPVKETATRWDEKCGALYDMSIMLDGIEKEISFGLSEKTVTEDGSLLINGRKRYLRMETNRALFPEYFYPPMDEDSWDEIFTLYESYGVNSVYFDRWCPPEAAFTSADRRGILLFPSVSIEDSEEDHDYYETERLQIHRQYAGHPSYCADLLTALKIVTVQGVTMLPDFSEIDLFAAHLRPENLNRMRELASQNRLLTKWGQAVEASGREALRAYKRKIEAAYLEDAAGIRIDSLQDLPAGKMKFAGLVNSHLRQKPYDFARPKRFCAMFGPIAVLIVLPQRSYETGETASAEVLIVNHTDEDISDRVIYSVFNENDRVLDGAVGTVTVPAGRTESAGFVSIRTEDGIIDDSRPQKLTLRVSFRRVTNEEDLFFYPPSIPVCPENVYECETLDDIAKEFLNLGGNVFLTPDVPDEPFSLPLLLTDVTNPLIYHFPGHDRGLEAFEGFLSGAMLPVRRNERPVIMRFNVPDYETPEGCLFEYSCRNGNVLVSTLNLKKKMDRPEVRELIGAIYDYMGSYEFSPRDEIRIEDLQQLVSSIREAGV